MFSIAAGARKIARCLVIIAVAWLVAAMLSGCGIARLAYNNADWLLLREMDAYLNLSSEQREQAAVRLRERLEAHRRSELPGYAHYLRRLRRLAGDRLSEDEADWIVDQGYLLAKRTIGYVIPAVAPSLAGLSKRQLVHLQSHLAIINQDYRDEYLPASRELRRERRVRRTVSRIEHWTGALRNDQVMLAGRLRNEFPDSAEDWLAYNTVMQRSLVTVLRNGAGVPAIEKFLIHWWIDLGGREPSLKGKNEVMIDGIKQMIVAIDETLDQRQRNYLLKRIDRYIDQVEVLRQPDK